MKSISKFCLFILPMFWASFATAQNKYSINYVNDFLDETSVASTVNLWQTVPGGAVCAPNTLTPGYDGSLFCLDSTGNGKIWKYSIANQTWTWQSAMYASATTAIAVFNSNTFWSLQTTSYCTGVNSHLSGVFKWNGSAWTQPESATCLSSLDIGADGTLVGIGGNQNNQIFTDSGAGTNWQWLANNFSYVSLYTQNFICAVGGGKLYGWNGSTSSFVEASNQPTGTIVGCANMVGYGHNQATAQANALLVAWNTAGNVYFLSQAANWTRMTGLSPSSLVGHTKSQLYALDSNGAPHHWNVFIPRITGTVTGSYSQFPAGMHDNTAHHDGVLWVYFADRTGVNYSAGQQTQQIAWNGNMNLSSWDASANCDLQIQPGTANSCQVIQSGDNTCSQAGLLNDDDPDPFQFGYISIDWQKYNGGEVSRVGPTLLFSVWFGTASLTTVDACTIGQPTCVGTGPLYIEYSSLDNSEAGYLWVAARLQEVTLESPWVEFDGYSYDPITGIVRCDGAQVIVPTWGASSADLPCK